MTKRDRIYWVVAAPSVAFLSWLLLKLTPAESWLPAFSMYMVMFLGLFALSAYLKSRYGPEIISYWSFFWSILTNSNCAYKHQHLFAGRKYRVVREFVDYDKQLHPVGETWTFLAASFLPYEDGLTIYISFEGKQKWRFRMQWREEEMGPILNSLKDYIQKI